MIPVIPRFCLFAIIQSLLLSILMLCWKLLHFFLRENTPCLDFLMSLINPQTSLFAEISLYLSEQPSSSLCSPLLSLIWGFSRFWPIGGKALWILPCQVWVFFFNYSLLLRIFLLETSSQTEKKILRFSSSCFKFLFWRRWFKIIKNNFFPLCKNFQDFIFII